MRTCVHMMLKCENVCVELYFFLAATHSKFRIFSFSITIVFVVINACTFCKIGNHHCRSHVSLPEVFDNIS